MADVKPKLGANGAIIEKLSPAHAGAVANFSCGSEDEDIFLKKDALANQDLGLSQTFLLFENGSKNIISYITLSIGSFRLDREEAIGGVRIMDKQCNIFSNNLPCLFIGKLATDRGEQGRGAARFLIDFAISRAVEMGRLIPVPFVALDAYPDKAQFYGRMGFRPAFTPEKGSRTIEMYLRIKTG